MNLGNIEDKLDATCEALEALASQCDLIMTTGGVSVGEEDHVKPAVEKLGELNLWKIRMKPGKPLGIWQSKAEYHLLAFQETLYQVLSHFVFLRYRL